MFPHLVRKAGAAIIDAFRTAQQCHDSCVVSQPKLPCARAIGRSWAMRFALGRYAVNVAKLEASFPPLLAIWRVPFDIFGRTSPNTAENHISIAPWEVSESAERRFNVSLASQTADEMALSRSGNRCPEIPVSNNCKA